MVYNTRVYNIKNSQYKKQFKYMLYITLFIKWQTVHYASSIELAGNSIMPRCVHAKHPD